MEPVSQEQLRRRDVCALDRSWHNNFLFSFAHWIALDRDVTSIFCFVAIFPNRSKLELGESRAQSEALHLFDPTVLVSVSNGK